MNTRQSQPDRNKPKSRPCSDLVASDPRWPAEAAAAMQEITNALPKDLIFRIEHVGSTSVPGMRASPTLDLAALVPSLDKINAYLGAITDLGYELSELDSGKGRLYFFRSIDDEICHYLLFTENPTEFQRQVLFRNYLRENPLAARECEGFKIKLVSKYPEDRRLLRSKKSIFVEKILEDALKMHALTLTFLK